MGIAWFGRRWSALLLFTGGETFLEKQSFLQQESYLVIESALSDSADVKNCHCNLPREKIADL